MLGTRTVRERALARLKLKIAVKKRRFLNKHPSDFFAGVVRIGWKSPVFIIAEIGVNHNGKVEEAKKLIRAAKEAGAQAVKFQKRNINSLYQEKVLENPALFDQSLNYLVPILKEMEFGEKEYKELKKYADEQNILIFGTPFDEESVDFLKKHIDPPLYKVASADLVNIPLLEKLIEQKKPLILSTGMSTLDEIDATVRFLHERGAVFALLHCQSTYPAGAETLNLRMIQTLGRRYGVPVGYSGHEMGIDHTISAVALGAKIIERHITFNQEEQGPDHSASLLPEQFKELVKRIRECERALGFGNKQITRGEVMNKLALRKSLVAKVTIPRDTKITRDMLTVKGPGGGLSPQRIYDLVGKTAKRDIAVDESFMPEDISDTEKITDINSIGGRWGLKARFSEIETLLSFKPRPAFLEFHLSDKDLDFEFKPDAKYPFGLYVHAPEYNDRDPVDMASDDPKIRENSIQLMQKTIDKTRDIAKHFEGKPTIVIHVGGIGLKPHPNPHLLVERAIEAFKKLDASGVELLPENLPAFGWFFGGLWNISLFGAPEQMVEFCKTLNLKMCLDLSHAWLFCQAEKRDYLEFIKEVAPFVRHLHIADGRGTSKEGLQIGEGDVPFKKAFEILEKNVPNVERVTWVPEIWQGHLDDYREFRIALQKLSVYSFFKR